MESRSEVNAMIDKFMGYDNPNDPLHIMSKYDSSWDWLMPVVEKIEDIELSRNHNPVVTIEKYITIISDNGEAPIVQSQTDSRIEGAYNAVVKFIKWYNRQSK